MYMYCIVERSSGALQEGGSGGCSVRAANKQGGRLAGWQGSRGRAPGLSLAVRATWGQRSGGRGTLYLAITYEADHGAG